MTNPFYSAGLGITGRWLGPNMARHHAACQSNNMVGVSIKQMFRNVFIMSINTIYETSMCAADIGDRYNTLGTRYFQGVSSFG